MQLVDHTRTDKNAPEGHNYLETYQRLFEPLRNTTNTIMEIGVDKGGSLQLWSDFFTEAKIVGVDIIDPHSGLKDLEENPRVSLFLRNSAYNLDFFESNFLEKLKCDVIIDDGPHTLSSMLQFIVMYSKLLTDTGVMIVEDVQDIEWIETLRTVVPDHLRPFIEVYDLRHVANRWDDILFVINRNKRPPVLENPQICDGSTGGLGNTLYKVACAIDYCERNPNATIVISKLYPEDGATGTAETCDRKQALRDPNTNEPVPYALTIFSKFAFADTFPTPRVEFCNHYDLRTIAWDSKETHLVIDGYQQHRDMFLNTMRAWPNYFNLYNKNMVRHLVNTYGNGKPLLDKFVCIGIRRCQDFKHMKSITNRVINRTKKEFYPDKHALIVSDNGTTDPIADGDEPLDFQYTIVKEPDIVQLNLAYLCRAMICSESTFHAWLGYFMDVAYETTDITCFNDTDLTRRNLTLPHWRHVDL